MSTSRETQVHGALLSGAGNRFVLVDGRGGGLPVRPAAFARRVCATTFAGGFRADGVLFLAPSETADAYLRIHNADGSRAEACGNGLRCVGWFLATRDVARARLLVDTDRGARAALVARDGDAVSVRVCLGPARILASATELAVDTGTGSETVQATLVDVGNPHCVVFVDDVENEPVAERGAALAKHPRFAHGTNVEFVAREGSGLRVRVWERGVGETAACGTGAAAAAVAAVERFGISLPLQVAMPGGELTVAGDGELWLSGPVEDHGAFDWAG